MKIISQFYDKKFILFLLVNGFAAFINLGSRIIIGNFFSYAWSIVIAYLIGMMVAYLLCRRYLFQSEKNKIHQEVFYFVIVNGVGIFIALFVSLFLFHVGLMMIKDIFIREEIAHFIGIGAPAFMSYVGHKYITFR
ncbi:MAG: hypothetical protein ACD_29C00336G0002 [uncultured bacterium]|nr:MAG: hypothetical protein ACD_29C00336G0002 [uncultured bacterium]OGT34289.1 MAG: hypothetical protein A3C44_07445 [Gammaproteobacteria bacterium RIFCSPHIGHO2_02_FULL_39_13]OGT48938.1 MAG: hypothetical protein A3E53_01425 [Gammaproteobacteria bacterium RIFCSPHIGHO2_12_FULL_39_24]